MWLNKFLFFVLIEFVGGHVEIFLKFFDDGM
jgi:hypothetical protein